MLQRLHAAWRARRVLLLGGTDCLTLFMHTLLEELGARPARLSVPCEAQTLERALHEGRIACVIVTRLHALCEGTAARQLHALDALLTEIREAGVPLTILLSDEGVYRCSQRSWYAREEDLPGGETRGGLIQSLLQLYADGAGRGLLGDPVSVQCVRHLPCLGCGHPAVAPAEDWCRALDEDRPLDVTHPGAQGVFLHPLDVCCGALLLGARYLSGDRTCTGFFNLGAGPQNLMPNRTAALRMSTLCGGKRPLRETGSSCSAMLPLPDGTKARLLCGACTLIPGEEALRLFYAYERSAQAGCACACQTARMQTLEYLQRMSL